MITGQVTAFYEAVIPIRLPDTTGRVHEFEAILDTGFNGTLTLPSGVIISLQLPWRTRGSATLANGSERHLTFMRQRSSGMGRHDRF